VPVLYQQLLWMFPKRKQNHKQLDGFMEILDTIIEDKRKLLAQGVMKNGSLDKNEKTC
jgi:hypothetical protein